MPEMEEGNEEIWQLLMIVNTQWLSANGGIYGINLQPVIQVAGDLGIERDLSFYWKIKAFEKEWLSYFGRSSGCNEKQKAKCREMFGDNLEWACEHCEDKSEVVDVGSGSQG